MSNIVLNDDSLRFSRSYDFNMSLRPPLTSCTGTSPPSGGASAPGIGATSLKYASMSLLSPLAVDRADMIFDLLNFLTSHPFFK